MLPSGGGIRVLRQFAEGLSGRFQIRVYRPAGGSALGEAGGTDEVVIPYPLWKRPAGLLKPAAPLFLMLRLLSFRSVCRKAADAMNDWADAAVIFNTMPVAAPPVFKHLTVPNRYFCYEYPRHIYEKDIIRRSGSRFTELMLKPLEAMEKAMDRKAVHHAEGVITFSDYMRGRIENIYGRKSSLIRPGVDTDFLAPDPRCGRENFVLSVGALWPFKGHETAIGILGAMAEEERPGLVIIADRAYPGHRRKLEDMAGTAGVTLAIRESVTDTELRELYRSSRLVLCCQRREPYGLVPLEAMACGTPVMAIAEGGFRDNIEDRITGFLFDGTVKNGASVLREVLANHEMVSETASSGRNFVLENRGLAAGSEQLAREIDGS